MKLLKLTAVLCASVAMPAMATELEVTHWWTSGGEAAAVAELAKAFDATGNKWVDGAIAGSGDTARPIMVSRITGGDPMAATQFNHGRQAEELVEAVRLMVGGNPQGKIDLARILGKTGNDYQRCLWYAVAGRGALTVAADLHWLTGILATRAEVWLGQKGWDRAVTKQPDPYVTDRPEGPVGRFRSSFELGTHWDGIADRR